MPKILKYCITALIGILIGAALMLLALKLSGVHTFDRLLGITSAASSPSHTAGAEVSDAELTDYAYTILGYIKAGDYEALADAVHPEYGLVFSPYANISFSTDKCFTPDQVRRLGTDDTTYIWGTLDGSGAPIEMTPADYFKQFVYDRDYLNAPVVGVNYIVKTGNALENITSVFPDIKFVEFHFPPSGADSDGLDWSTLRLGFEEYNGALRLTLILHSQWTV